MAYITVSRELAAQYPDLKDKVGKTITSAELQVAKNNATNAPATESAPASASAPAPRKRVAKKAARKTASKKKAK